MTLPVPTDQKEKVAEKRNPLHRNFPAEPPGQRSGEGREPYGSVGERMERLEDVALVPLLRLPWRVDVKDAAK